MTDIVWEDPPRSAAGRPSVWLLFVAELKKHPGKWAIAKTGGAHSASHGGARQRLKSLGCEAIDRKQPDGTYTLYARWPEVSAS